MNLQSVTISTTYSPVLSTTPPPVRWEERAWSVIFTSKIKGKGTFLIEQLISNAWTNVSKIIGK